jgi:uncharacterized protein (UPF0335 family)
MGVVEDVRSVLQDFLAPQLGELRVRIDALENQQKEFRSDVKEQFGEVKGRFNSLDARFEKLETKLADRHEEVIAEIRRAATIHDLTARVARLEAERRPAH